MKGSPILQFLVFGFLYNVIAGEPPRVVDELGDVTVNEEGTDARDDRVWLRCNIAGTPVPHFSWLKDGEPVNLTIARVFRTSSGSNLLIKPVQLTDAGEYTCQGENSEGSASTTATVTVNPAPPLRYTKAPNHVCMSMYIVNLRDVTVHDCQRACDARAQCTAFDVPHEDTRSCSLKDCTEGSDRFKPYDGFDNHMKPN